MAAIIMVPGLGSDATVWERTIDALGRDYDCRIGDTLHDDSVAGMARRILDDAPDRFALAGVSMGGMVALTILGMAPERVTHLALFDTNARADTPEQIARRRVVNEAMLAATDLRALAAPTIAYMVHPKSDRDVHEALSDITIRVGAATYARQNEAVAAREDLTPVLAQITVPTLVAVGADDLMTPVAMSQEIADAIPTATLHVIRDCGHLPPIEKPAEAAALLRTLLAA